MIDYKALWEKGRGVPPTPEKYNATMAARGLYPFLVHVYGMSRPFRFYAATAEKAEEYYCNSGVKVLKVEKEG